MLVEVDAFEIVDNDVSAIRCKSIIILLGDVEHELEALGVVALGDPAHLENVNTSLDL